MESSASLFSIQGSPFAVQSPARSHYHPSPIRPPGPQHQRMALSPVRLLPGVPAVTPHPQCPSEPAVSRPPDLSFLQGTSCQGTALDSDSTDPFPESWPSTERTSPDTPQETAALGQPLHPPASKQDRESIIAKYIERFRHGQPSSRSQRQMPPAHPNKEFWWLEPAPPSVSSTPKGRAKPDCAKLEEVEPGWALTSPPLRPEGSPSDTTLLESPDADTHSLQERAAQLLLRSESSLSSTVPVSSEGLRSTPPHSTPDLDQALPSPPQLSLPKPSSGRLLPSTCWPPARFPQCSSSTRPEDDILFQWRLRRKMEQASQAGSSLLLLGWSPRMELWKRLRYSRQYPFLSPPLHLLLQSERACTGRPGPGLLPDGMAWRSGDGTTFPAPAAQPEVRSGPEWAPGPTTLLHGVGHSLEVPFLSMEPVVGQSPMPVSLLGQLAPAATPSSTPQPEGDGGGAAERWSARDAQRGMGPAEGPGSQDARRGTGLAEGPGSQDARRGTGLAEGPGSQDARRGTGPAEGPGSQDARRGTGPVEGPGSQDARRGTGPAEGPGSQDARRGTGPVEGPGSQDARRGTGPAQGPGSQDARRGTGPAQGPGSQDARRGTGPVEGPGSQDARRGTGPAQGPGSQDARRGTWTRRKAQHISKETQPLSKPELSQGRVVLKPEAASSQKRRARKAESPLHSALGQVISERLFSPLVTTKGHQSGQGAVSPPEQGTAAELPAPGSQHPQLLHLAAQLLEEAEESDGAEFEEDPLLQLLRGQRENLRSQLWAVDIAVSQLVSQPPRHPC
ncbi:proline and serine-rich protein 3 isoform X3 [Pelodiscus sinensis]|uniref:proline and serine-rich protein 3 isoform X3 n=1 Tax=Pelodiscus sinensis TaxID=13735 RepID=UPI003F6C7087